MDAPEAPETHEATTDDIAQAQVAHDAATSPASTNGYVETSPAERQGHAMIFQHSRFLHVGPGAEHCEDVDEERFISTCSNPLHFHCWIHTPNQFQHNSIREKSLAAKARKLRALRDLDSDSRTILDGELEQLRYDNATELLIEEIVQRDGVKTYWQAMREVQEEEEFQHYEEDRDRYNALHAKPPEERDEEEYTKLAEHIREYTERVREVMDEINRPLRESLEGKSIEELIELVTEDRIQSEASAEFDDTYSLWEWYIGCMKLWRRESPGHPNDRIFTNVENLKQAPPEVISALAEAFTELDAEAGRALGNS